MDQEFFVAKQKVYNANRDDLYKIIFQRGWNGGGAGELSGFRRTKTSKK
nr:MAG TPA: hypothetical protein [Caudoviricetes sp.]